MPHKWYSFSQHFFNASELKEKPERIIENTSDEGYYLGNINTTDSYRIGLFHYNIRQGSVANKRVGLRNLVKSFINPTWGEFDAALVVFDSGDHWRLSFICDIKGEATSPKRYTYVFGSDDLLYRTPIERFNFLKKKGISFENLRTAFSVEALSDEFFDKYREQYADFIQYATGKRFVKVGSKWEEKVLGEPNTALMQAFNHNEKKIRDYVKKMMGRITFLHFLQRKGWMCEDLNYMQNMFENSPYKNDYLDSVLEPLFFGILNTKPAEREALFADYDWDKSLLNEWKDIPYLNGGLFERDEEDEPESRFPADYFKRLFQFFSEYNFTIDENDPNDAEVGVDPEMLGKIFENLLEDNKDKGAFYTPKEIVRYMCQESLIAYLETNTSVAKDKIRKFVLSPEDGVADIPDNKKPKLLTTLEEVKICDPAIGSGAFPMGLLNELLHCREVLSGERYDRAEIKKSIIQNNIYGVDIEKGAVDIARLRFWLSIVVDEETPSPLPNLDYKIMQGNSLIESFMGVDLSKLTYEKEYKKDKGEILLFDDEKNRLQKTVSHLLSSYYSCSDHGRKVKLQQDISDTINKQLEAQAYDPVILGKLKTINLAENKKFFLWHTWFSDVFSRPSKEGFDIVIGNPPYGANIDDLVSLYEELYPNTSHGYKDIYKYFYDFGLSICKNNGVVCYITPNTFLRQPRYGDLRRVLLEFNILQILDLGENIFEDAVVPVAICLCKAITSPTVTFFADLTMDITVNNAKNILNNIRFLQIDQECWNTTQNNVFIDNIRKTKHNEDILDNILEMKDCGFKYQRFNVGLSQKGKNDLAERLFYKPTSGRIEDERDIPILIGKEISSFYHSLSPQKCLRYNYETLLKSNETTYYNKKIMNEPIKLIWRQTAPYFIGTILANKIFFGNTIQAGIIKEAYKDIISYEYLCGLLNSQYLRNIYEQNVKEGGRVFPQVKLEKLKPLPIVIPTKEERKKVEDIVSQIIDLRSKSQDTEDLEVYLNQVVNKLYMK
ncbi:N-6 DNA methylase [Bacteroides xylanisolvens]|uniref:Eco57I restriction-modification methylase domain-containing protein n=2 Tax=Bacteroides xylanisolvens TaxID=371601 RepID=UPI00125ED25D|nr:N-6 DNA methylase [Bacteroides xylanisolvens]KAB6436547.1 N-6 DNA methylase [Bacteroides xylanisolvens]